MKYGSKDSNLETALEENQPLSVVKAFICIECLLFWPNTKSEYLQIDGIATHFTQCSQELFRIRFLPSFCIIIFFISILS